MQRRVWGALACLCAAALAAGALGAVVAARVRVARAAVQLVWPGGRLVTYGSGVHRASRAWGYIRDGNAQALVEFYHVHLSGAGWRQIELPGMGSWTGPETLGWRQELWQHRCGRLRLELDFIDERGSEGAFALQAEASTPHLSSEVLQVSALVMPVRDACPYERGAGEVRRWGNEVSSRDVLTRVRRIIRSWIP